MSETREWMTGIRRDGCAMREAREQRIVEFAREAGSPHTEIMLGEQHGRDPEVRVGFWHVASGLIRIEADAKGQFDPDDRTDITCEELNAMARARAHEMVPESKEP